MKYCIVDGWPYEAGFSIAACHATCPHLDIKGQLLFEELADAERCLICKVRQCDWLEFEILGTIRTIHKIPGTNEYRVEPVEVTP